MSKINTPVNVAAKLGVSERTVQLRIKKLGIVAIERIGKTQILSDAQVKQIASAKSTPGPEKKAKK